MSVSFHVSEGAHLHDIFAVYPIAFDPSASQDNSDLSVLLILQPSVHCPVGVRIILIPLVSS